MPSLYGAASNVIEPPMVMLQTTPTSTVVPPNVPNAILGELRTAGTANIIRNREITEAINVVVTGYNYYMSFHGDIIERITPRADYVNQFVTFRIDPNIGAKPFIEWDEVSFDIDVICEDREFYASVSTVRRHVYEIIRWNKLALDRHEQLAGTLAAELDRLN